MFPPRPLPARPRRRPHMQADTLHSSAEPARSAQIVSPARPDPRYWRSYRPHGLEMSSLHHPFHKRSQCTLRGVKMLLAHRHRSWSSRPAPRGAGAAGCCSALRCGLCLSEPVWVGCSSSPTCGRARLDLHPHDAPEQRANGRSI